MRARSIPQARTQPRMPFDEEPTLRVDNLLEELKLYPRLRSTLRRLNSIALPSPSAC